MLNSAEIERELVKIGFRLTRPNKRIHEYSRKSLVVYVKTPSNKSQKDFVEGRYNPLLIHPDNRTVRTHFDGLSGVTINWFGRYKNSNMGAFPIDQTAVSDHMYYGYEVGVESTLALNKFVSVLVGDTVDANENDTGPGYDAETVRQALVDARVGQGLFRQHLLGYWKKCAVTGITAPELLKASHIKPWRDSRNTERLDLYNGLLLSANLDAAFDSGLISFLDNGDILISPELSSDANAAGIHSAMQLSMIEPSHLPYLQHHREHIFRK
ncbi:HNH endonuclease [Kistimonas asteriae]|uniref:HNH endonuclease n=1 Tax=Kistimonas asteriae TaxID=517724 RepID=UPI001BA62DF2|nr:HNH endonuclease [Kistimonas asteriae]